MGEILVEAASTPREWLDAAADLAARFAEGAAERDLARAFPHEQLRWLRESGLETLLVPEEDGGLGGDLADACRITDVLAEGDPNVAQIYHVHLTGNELLNHAPEELRAELVPRVAARELRFTNAYSERGTRTIAEFRTTVVRDGDDYVLDGTKFFCTGSLGGDETVAIGRDPDADVLRVLFVPLDAPGVTVVDDWSSMGQATTASGTTVFEGVRVPAWRAIPIDWQSEPDEPFTLFSPLSLSAIYVGIAKNAFADMVRYASTRTRPWLMSGLERAAEDPYLLQHVGELRTLLDAADGLQERATRALRGALVERSPGNRAAASVAMSQAKAFCGEAGVRIAETLFQVCGASATLEAHGLSRHWRNVRTLSVNDPADYRWKMVGDYYLNGTPPPVTGSS